MTFHVRGSCVVNKVTGVNPPPHEVHAKPTSTIGMVWSACNWRDQTEQLWSLVLSRYFLGPTDTVHVVWL